MDDNGCELTIDGNVNKRVCCETTSELCTGIWEQVKNNLVAAEDSVTEMRMELMGGASFFDKPVGSGGVALNNPEEAQYSNYCQPWDVGNNMFDSQLFTGSTCFHQHVRLPEIDGMEAPFSITLLVHFDDYEISSQHGISPKSTIFRFAGSNNDGNKIELRVPGSYDERHAEATISKAGGSVTTLRVENLFGNGENKFPCEGCEEWSDGTSPVIVEPAAMKLPSPSVTGATRLVLQPMKTPSPTVVRYLAMPS